MNNITEKLLPCRYCGQTSGLFTHEEHESNYVGCHECNIMTDCFVALKDAIAAWNRRDAEKPKWTNEPPTEEGLYWQHMGIGRPQICYVYPHADLVRFINGHVMCLTQDSGFDDIKIWWLKATRPEPPALPEEGEIT